MQVSTLKKKQHTGTSYKFLQIFENDHLVGYYGRNIYINAAFSLYLPAAVVCCQTYLNLTDICISILN